MTDVMAAILANHTNTIHVPEHMPMVCLVLYLFLEFDDDKHRATQLSDLFYRYRDPAFFQVLEDTVRQDENAQACLTAANQAVVENKIEQYSKDYDFDRFEPDRLKTPEFYTVSFLAWAESAGHIIPEYIMKELKTKIDYYFQSKGWRDEERRKFSAIDHQEFEHRTREPLWQMTDAILYALGYQSEVGEEAKINFLRYKDRAKRLMAYALDAQKADDLKLYDFNRSGFEPSILDVLDADASKAMEEKRLKIFYASKIKPKEFVAWLHGLALDLPILSSGMSQLTESGKADEIINPIANQFSFEGLLHPIILKSSYKQYQDGHLRDAVLNSVVAIFDYIREKTGISEDGDKLIGQAFSLNDPFIVLSELQSESGQSDQKGFMQIYKGAYQGIRNPKAHSLVHDLTEQKAAQYLVFASLLARRIEEASFPKVI